MHYHCMQGVVHGHTFNERCGKCAPRWYPEQSTNANSSTSLYAFGSKIHFWSRSGRKQPRDCNIKLVFLTRFNCPSGHMYHVYVCFIIRHFTCVRYTLLWIKCTMHKGCKWSSQCLCTKAHSMDVHWTGCKYSLRIFLAVYSIRIERLQGRMPLLSETISCLSYGFPKNRAGIILYVGTWHGY